MKTKFTSVQSIQRKLKLIFLYLFGSRNAYRVELVRPLLKFNVGDYVIFTVEEYNAGKFHTVEHKGVILDYCVNLDSSRCTQIGLFFDGSYWVKLSDGGYNSFNFTSQALAKIDSETTAKKGFQNDLESLLNEKT